MHAHLFRAIAYGNSAKENDALKVQNANARPQKLCNPYAILMQYLCNTNVEAYTKTNACLTTLGCALTENML